MSAPVCCRPCALGTGRRVAALAVIASLLLGGLLEAGQADATPAAPSAIGAARKADEPNPITVTIDSVSPRNLAGGDPVRIAGTVTNNEDTLWSDVQIFLNIDPVPIRTQGQFDAITAAGPNAGFGLGPARPGLYDQIDVLDAHETRTFRLKIPQAELGSPSAEGVYHFGVRILGTNVLGRDSIPDGRADTFIPLVGKKFAGRSRILLMIPVTAPIHRWPDGSFMDDSLGRLIAPAGRLDNLLSLVDRAPPRILQVALDPGVVDAVDAMAHGYHIRRVSAVGKRATGRVGVYRDEATRWLATLTRVVNRQNLVLLPYADPDATTLRRTKLTSVLQASIAQAKRVAGIRGWNVEVAGWTSNGVIPRRAGTALLDLGANALVLSDRVLAATPDPVPALISYRSAVDRRTAIVTRSRLASVELSRSLTPVRLGRALLAQATVAALTEATGGQSLPPVVVGTDFDWDPGPNADAGDAFSALETRWVKPLPFTSLEHAKPTRYTGAIKASSPPTPALSALHLAHLRTYALSIDIYSNLVNTVEVSDAVRRDLAIAGSEQWRLNPGRGESLTGADASTAKQLLDAVTVTGPSSVALSSDSGRFPITVMNRLRVPVTVRILARTTAAGIELRELAPIVVQPGERQVVEMFGSAKGSTVSNVRIQLATSTGQRFGESWDFNLRTTQFGLLIWVVMAAGFAILIGTAVWRVFRRIRRARTARTVPPSRASEPVGRAL
jgi:hypothetical protein